MSVDKATDNQVGTASWGSFVLAVFANSVLQKSVGPLIADLVVMLLMVVGFCCGVGGLALALKRPPMKKSGAIVGLVLNSVLILVFVSNFLARAG